MYTPSRGLSEFSGAKQDPVRRRVGQLLALHRMAQALSFASSEIVLEVSVSVAGSVSEFAMTALVNRYWRVGYRLGSAMAGSVSGSATAEWK